MSFLIKNTEAVTAYLQIVQYKFSLKRSQGTGQNRVGYAVVEWTGSAWSVQNNIEHEFLLVATTETEAISNVGSWAQTLIFHSFRTPYTASQQVSYPRKVL